MGHVLAFYMNSTFDVVSYYVMHSLSDAECLLVASRVSFLSIHFVNDGPVLFMCTGIQVVRKLPCSFTK